MSALLFYLSIALVISFICSLTEAVLLSIPQSYLASIRDDQKWAGSLLSYKEDIDKPLSAIFLKRFVDGNLLFKITQDSSLLGREFINNSFLESYLKENLLEISKDLK